MAVNALDSLTPVQRSEVLNRTLASDISCELGKATSLAAQQGQDLYLPAGLWLNSFRLLKDRSSPTG